MRDQVLLMGLRQARRATWILPFLPLVASAKLNVGSNYDGPVGDNFATVDKLITSGFNIVIVVAGVAFVVLLLIGGVMYLASAGNEDGTKKAKALLVDAVIGLVIVVVAWAVGNYVLDLLGICPDIAQPGQASQGQQCQS